MSTVFNFYLAEKMSQSSIIGNRGKNVSLTINNIKYAIKMFVVGCLINFIFTKINSLTYPRERFLCKSQIHHQPSLKLKLHLSYLITAS